ncbi:MAG: SDR family oxidoreductase [Chlorobium sp.]|nr:MAG: SDR family oxidoreductase [Chlorobium sp.]
MKKKHNPDSLGVVITGGSKGVGYALAAAFLLAGDRVVICGRNLQRLEDALHSLRQLVPQGELFGIECDVGDPLGGKALAEFASVRLGIVDRWINNAGSAGKLKRPLWELHADDILETCTTNLSGSILLCAEAVRVMARQPHWPEPRYHIFNMGFSSTGASFSRSAVPHKASKRGVAEVTRFLSRELKTAGKTSIGVHELSPGLVLTGLLLEGISPQSRRIVNVMAESPEKVASVLVPKIRSITGSNRSVRYQPLVLTFWKLLAGLPQIFASKDIE